MGNENELGEDRSDDSGKIGHIIVLKLRTGGWNRWR